MKVRIVSKDRKLKLATFLLTHALISFAFYSLLSFCILYNNVYPEKEYLDRYLWMYICIYVICVASHLNVTLGSKQKNFKN